MKKRIIALSTAAALLSTAFVAPASASSTTYIVKKGDTLTKIAKTYNTTVTTLKKINNLTSNTIKVKQKLVVSTSSTTTTGQASAATEKTETTTSATKVTTNTYTVVKGDTLSKISRQTGMTVTKLKALNNLKSNTIKVGQKLKLENSFSGIVTTTSLNTESSTSALDINKVISEAKKVIGTPYKWAGTTTAGFDCSGFVYYAFKQAGYDISRQTAASYYKNGTYTSSPEAGDLVFFATGSSRSNINHMGIYLGDNQFIHSSSSKGVQISSVTSTYYKERLIGYKKSF